MDNGQEERVVATRQLWNVDSSPPLSIAVRLFAPRLVDTRWRCAFDIGFPEMYKGEAVGVDSMQALQMAIEGLRVVLRDSGMILQWCDKPGLIGFPMSVPIAWGPEIQAQLEATLEQEERRLVANVVKSRKP